MYKMQLMNSIVYPTHDYPTRNCNNAVPSFQRLAMCTKSLSYNGPKIFNTIPQSIRISSSLKLFKSRYKEYLVCDENN